MAHSHYFDVIIIGDGIGGLYAGLLLSRAGARVAILGQLGDLPPDEPFVSPVVQMRPIQGVPSLFYHLLEGAMAHQVPANLFLQRAPGFQWIGPDLRLDFTSGDDLVRELKRERPELLGGLSGLEGAFDRCGSALDGVLADAPLPARGFFEGRAVKKALGKLDCSLPEEVMESELAPLLRGVALAEASVPLQGEIGLAELRSLSRWRDGDSVLVDGRRGLVQHLASLCTRHGAKVDLDARVTELGLKGWKVEEVAHSAGQPYGCGSLIVSRNADQLMRLVPGEGKVRRGLEEYASQARAENLVVGVRMSLSARAIPTPLRDRAILVPSRPVVEGASPIVIALDPQKDGNRLLTAAVAVPGTSESPPEFTRRVGRILFDRLEEAIPFLPENVPGGPEGVEVLQAYAYSCASGGVAGVEGLDPKTPLSNGWLVSRQVLPGLGLEGEFLVGRRVASWLHKGVVQPRAGAIARAIRRA